MIWYQYLFLLISIALYSLKDIQQFWGLKWSKKGTDFWGSSSWLRKYKGYLKSNGPAFFGSTTFLVFLTDGVHLFQFLFKIFLTLGIFGFTWSSIIGWLVWTGIQWACFKWLSKAS